MFYYAIMPFCIHMLTYWLLSFNFYLLDLKYLDPTNINWKKYNLAIRTTLFNQFVITLPTIFLLRTHIQNSVEASQNDTLQISIIKMILISNLSNITFYLLHRLLHYKKMFKYIHYKHHEFVEPIAAAAYYSHPIEHLFANTLSFLIPYILIGTTYSMMIFLIIFVTVITVIEHTTYIIFNDHVLHHKFYKYNFSFGSYIDRIFQTNHKK